MAFRSESDATLNQPNEGPCAYSCREIQKNASNIKVAVIGAGFLGKCIAIDLSLVGVQVIVYDTNLRTADALSAFTYELLNPLLYLGYVTKAMVTQACSNIKVVNRLKECADVCYVIEAIPEKLPAKVDLFNSLHDICSASTIFATSTIDLSVDAIQQQLKNPERFLGVRFFHPCVLVRPVEVTVGSETSQDTVDRVVAFLLLIDKLPHRGPTKRVLTNKEISAFQFDTAVRGGFYHGLLEPKRIPLEEIPGQPGPALVRPGYNGNTTAL